MNARVGHWSIEDLLEFAQDRDKQMDEQDTYFDVSEELAFRVSNLLACVRMQDRQRPTYAHGHMLYTDEIREALADHAV